jgi:hypothetical protein
MIVPDYYNDRLTGTVFENSPAKCGYEKNSNNSDGVAGLTDHAGAG